MLLFLNVVQEMQTLTTTLLVMIRPRHRLEPNLRGRQRHRCLVTLQ